MKPIKLKDLPASAGRTLREIVGGRKAKEKKMNGIETRFSRILEAAKKRGEIQRWGFEEVAFRLAPSTVYNPDFLAVLPQGQWLFIETKGYLRDDAAVKFKIAAGRYPEHSWVMLKEDKKTKEFIPIYSFPNKHHSLDAWLPEQEI